MKEGTETRILMDFLTDGQLDWAPIDDQYDIVSIDPAQVVKMVGFGTNDKCAQTNDSCALLFKE